MISGLYYIISKLMEYTTLLYVLCHSFLIVMYKKLFSNDMMYINIGNFSIIQYKGMNIYCENRIDDMKKLYFVLKSIDPCDYLDSFDIYINKDWKIIEKKWNILI